MSSVAGASQAGPQPPFRFAATTVEDVHSMVRPRRRPWGCAALLLPHLGDGSVDWESFTTLVRRTLDAGLTPAVNMDTGFVQMLDEATRRRVLETTARLVAEHPASTGRSDPFLAGAFVADTLGDPFSLDRYLEQLTGVRAAGGTPVVFPSHGLNALDPGGWVDAHRSMAVEVDRFVAFELGDQFVTYGRIYPLEAYRALLGIGACIGAKHSSLSREMEWDRLRLRDEVRPDFHVFTGNDLAIDMICYGSDYLLGLAAFCPDHFARRDEAWEKGDAGFHQLNDQLQYLGAFSFRPPVPAYRHDAARFLHHRGWIATSEVPDGAARRPDADDAVLAMIADELDDPGVHPDAEDRG